LAASPAVVYDGLEFKERAMLTKYISQKRRMKICTLVSMTTLAPALALLLLSYLEPEAYPEYLYLVFLAVSIPFSILSFQANSRLTEMINSNEVRHVTFG
jgi:hypothetical protein